MPNPIITTTPAGTTVNGSFYANLGNSDSAFPSTPPTPPAPAANPGIVSSTAANNSLASDGAALDKITSTPDPYQEYLQQKANGLMNNTSQPSTEERNAAMAGGRLQEKTVADYGAYKAGLATLGIESGLGKYAPELQADRMIKAANDETSKISDIQDKENLAIAKAKQARLDKDATTLKDTLNEIRQLKKDKADALQQTLNKRTQDITVANGIATYAYKQLQSLAPDQKEAFILQLSKDNNISPLVLQEALASEQDRQTKFDLTTALQEKSLAGGGAGSKPLSTAALNYITKNNPLVDIGYGNTQAEADQYIALSNKIVSGLKTDFSDPSNLGPQGYFTFDAINQVLNNLPEGISKVGLMTQLYNDGMITPSLEKKGDNGKYNYEDYGLTKAEADTIMGN